MVCIEYSLHIRQVIQDLICQKVGTLFNDNFQISTSYQAHASYHVFESVFDGSNHQALLWNFLFSKEAHRWGAGRTRSPCGTTERGGPGEGALGCRGEVVIDRLLPKACGGHQVWSADDLHHFLKVQCDVVMQKVGSHNSHPRASVAIKQRPIVQG